MRKRPSLSIVVTTITTAVVIATFAYAYVMSSQTLARYAEAERQKLTEQQLASLEKSARFWLDQHLRFVEDLGRHSHLIQGVMQPELQLRSMRRHLDHVAFNGRQIQLSVYDFEANPLYHRFPETGVDLVNREAAMQVLEGSICHFLEARLVGPERTGWISLVAPIGRDELPEGLVVATVRYSTLRELLSIDPMNGIEISVGNVLLEKGGAVPLTDEIELADGQLRIAFGPNLAKLDASIAELENGLVGQLAISGLALLAVLFFVVVRLVARPLSGTVREIEAIEADSLERRLTHGGPYREIQTVTERFNDLLDRLATSRNALMSANENLETRVARRTAELELQNRKLAEFANAASHDLQEPLRKVVTFGELLDSKYADQMDDEARVYLGHMTSGAARMRELIRDLLAYSSVGTIDRQIRRVDTHAIVGEVLRDLSTSIEQANAQCSLAPLPPVRAHPTYIRQLFQNLISNALKFTSNGSPRVEIGVAEIGDDRCRIFVRDDGIGIEERYADKIYGMFERLHPASEYAGTGIGLAICKRIVEELGGGIGFVSKPGAGTTFFVTLPLAPDEGDSIEKPAAD